MIISTPKLPFRVDHKRAEYSIPRIVNNDGWVANAAENRVDFIVLACNYHARLRDQLQAVVRSATEEELGNAMQLLAELAKATQEETREAS